MVGIFPAGKTVFELKIFENNHFQNISTLTTAQSHRVFGLFYCLR